MKVTKVKKPIIVQYTGWVYVFKEDGQYYCNSTIYPTEEEAGMACDYSGLNDGENGPTYGPFKIEWEEKL